MWIVLAPGLFVVLMILFAVLLSRETRSGKSG